MKYSNIILPKFVRICDSERLISTSRVYFESQDTVPNKQTKEKSLKKLFVDWAQCKLNYK